MLTRTQGEEEQEGGKWEVKEGGQWTLCRHNNWIVIGPCDDGTARPVHRPSLPHYVHNVARGFSKYKDVRQFVMHASHGRKLRLILPMLSARDWKLPPRGCTPLHAGEKG